MQRERFYIIDAFAHIFRAYYAVRNIDNNAVFGFITMLKKLLTSERPEYIAVAFDTPTPTFRKELFPDYKANRQAMPEDLAPQIPLIKEVVQALNIPMIEKPGFEADDVMGTLAVKAAQMGFQAVIVSGDKDLLQLVKGEDIVVYDAKKDTEFVTEARLPEFFGCRPDQIIDLLTIWGDSSDNVPGVAGVGEKGAKSLLATYGTLENIYTHLDQIKRKSYREGFENARGRIELTRKLVTIRSDLNLEFDPKRFKNRGADHEKVRELFARLNFKTLLNDLPVELKTLRRQYTLLDCVDSLRPWVAEIEKRGFFVFDTETTSLNPLDAKLVGMSLALDEEQIGYIPLRHQGQDRAWAAAAESLLKPLFSHAHITKCAHNAKYDLSILMVQEWDLDGRFEDTMLMSYLLSPTDNRHGMDDLAEALFQYRTIHYEEVCGTGKDAITFDQVPVEEAVKYAGEDADICYRLYQKLYPRLEKEGLHEVYEKVERPLVPVLARMELNGVHLDKDHLKEMSDTMASRIEALEEHIYELAGERFNIKSTKQLGVILFEKLELPLIKKTSKTRSYSTDQMVLERLAAKGYPLPVKLLDYRLVTKLKSTYVDALPTMVHPKTGRVHSSFNQFVTATGRLSSNNPNLQNIPVRTEMGREIRAAFVPKPGWVLVAADYSQIELRLMAHFSRDKTLVTAFKEGQDIHGRTASEIMDVNPALVTQEMRSMAKSINFGLIYGMGDFRLAQELNITRKQARAYIKTYFEKMPDVLTFREKVIEKARESGEIRTFSGRKRALPEIQSRNQNLRSQGERLAVNTLIQGSAAEIIKLAMIELEREIRGKDMAAHLLLQVHDELVLECPENQAKALSGLLRRVMENVVDFRVPLTVDIHVGHNWKEVK